MDHDAGTHRRGPATERLERSWETRWRDGTNVTEQHAGIRRTTADSALTFTLALAPWKKANDLFWRYGFVAHDEQCADAAAVLSGIV